MAKNMKNAAKKPEAAQVPDVKPETAQKAQKPKLRKMLKF